VGFAVMNGVLRLIGPLIYKPNEEVGERMLFLETSARYAPAAGEEGSGVSVVNGLQVAHAMTDEKGAGVYSVDDNGESAGPKAVDFLSNLRKE